MKARVSGESLAEIRRKLPPTIHDAYVDMYRALWRDGRLGTRLRELLRLKSAYLAGCKH